MKKSNDGKIFDQTDDALIDQYVNESYGGNTRAAKILLNLFITQNFKHKAIHPKILEFVSDAFQNIICGEPSKNALCLSKKPCRPLAHYERDTDIAIRVQEKVNAGSTVEVAMFDISENYEFKGKKIALHESQIKKIYYKYKAHAISQIEAGIIVEGFVKPNN